jgi:histidinol-phosphatase (PHP family)
MGQKHLTPKDLHDTFDRYYATALHLREKYAPQIRLLIGFETEYIRPACIQATQQLLQKYKFDFVVGSIHHVRGIPIDYSADLWEKARDVCGGTDEALFAEYFDEQFALLRGIKPPIVGHFDVIRLWAPDKLVRLQQWPAVWEKVVRNIDEVNSYGGAFELNSAAFRKGFPEAYPTSEISSVRTLHPRNWQHEVDGEGNPSSGWEVCPFG